MDLDGGADGASLRVTRALGTAEEPMDGLGGGLTSVPAGPADALGDGTASGDDDTQDTTRGDGGATCHCQTQAMANTSPHTNAQIAVGTCTQGSPEVGAGLGSALGSAEGSGEGAAERDGGGGLLDGARAMEGKGAWEAEGGAGVLDSEGGGVGNAEGRALGSGVAT